VERICKQHVSIKKSIKNVSSQEALEMVDVSLTPDDWRWDWMGFCFKCRRTALQWLIGEFETFL